MLGLLEQIVSAVTVETTFPHTLDAVFLEPWRRISAMLLPGKGIPHDGLMLIDQEGEAVAVAHEAPVPIDLYGEAVGGNAVGRV